MHIHAFVLSCPERRATLQRTLEGLAQSGWEGVPELIIDTATEGTPIQRIRANWRKAIHIAALAVADYVLLLEDDLVFGRWFTHNLRAWPLLKSWPSEAAFFGSLYNPGRPYISRDPTTRSMVADPRWVWGSQALLMSLGTLRFLDENWEFGEGNPDMRMPRLARTITPIYYHVPSLVDHAPIPTTWGGIQHSAIDFDPDWLASGASNTLDTSGL